MAYIEEFFDRFSDGREVFKITISNENASVSFLTFGAIIHSFFAFGRNVVISSDSVKAYEKVSNGKIIGPFANRIGNACFVLNGKEYLLDKNNGKNNIHSGSANIGNHIWDIKMHDDHSVVLHTDHLAMDGGIPGNMSFDVRYSLIGTTLRIDYEVQTDADSIINPTNHVFFNLNEDNSTILDHQVRIDADYVLDVDKSLIPTHLIPVSGTDFDFTSFRRIGDRMNGAYDSCFALSGGHECILKAAGLSLVMSTDRPAMQLYTGKSLSMVDCPRGKIGAFGGVALETSGYPDAINHPEFPSAVIRRGDVFRSWTEYRVEKQS